MKETTSLLALLLLFTGCATFHSRRLSFDESVLKSIQSVDNRHQIIVIVGKTGDISLAGRKASLEELEGIGKITSLPDDIPEVLVRGHRQARHSDMRAVMDALMKAGIWKLRFAVLEETEKLQNKSMDCTSQ